MEQFNYEFSWLEYQEIVKHPRLVDNQMSLRGDDSKQDLLEWAGGTYRQAVELSETGWQAGVDRIEGMVENFTADVSSRLERVDWRPDVEAAGNLDIARYLENEPECWLNPETSIIAAQGKLIRILFNGSLSSGVEPEAVFANGAKVVALVQALELAGHSVELDWANATHNYEKTYTMWTVVHLKRFGDPLDISRCAFALCHPSMLRRLYFSVRGTYKESYLFGSEESRGGYIPCDPSMESMEGYDIYIPKVLSKHIVTASETSKWIDEQLAKCGVEVKWSLKEA